ncbi:hypothetical protein DFJ77DRAFT_425625, partial [Powellomyces hirtus]
MATSAKPGARKLQHYSKSQRILLIGEGDFTFARALAGGIGSGSNIVATSYDSLKDAVAKYPIVPATLKELVATGASILHNVDATRLSTNKPVGANVHSHGKFDRIVFQFPHKGGSQEEDIAENKEMLGTFFREAAALLTAEGEIHVTLRDTLFYQRWNIDQVGAQEGFALASRVPFESKKFGALGYTPQRT